MTRRRSASRAAAGLGRRATLPAVIWLLVVFAVPVAVLLGTSFIEYEDVELGSAVTLENYRVLVTDPAFLRTLAATVYTSLAAAAACVCLGYPVARFLVRSRSRLRSVVLAVVVSPLVASVVVRTYGWLVLLDNDGIVDQVIDAVGLTDRSVPLLGTYGAIVVGLTHVLLPFSVFTIMSALQAVPPNLEQAARDLGAGPVKTFLRVTLPLSLPGVIAGFILTTAISLGAYATPHILGAGRRQTLATMVRDAMTVTLQWGAAAAIAVIILVLGIVVVSLLMWSSRLTRRHTAEVTRP